MDDNDVEEADATGESLGDPIVELEDVEGLESKTASFCSGATNRRERSVVAIKKEELKKAHSMLSDTKQDGTNWSDLYKG